MLSEKTKSKICRLRCCGLSYRQISKLMSVSLFSVFHTSRKITQDYLIAKYNAIIKQKNLLMRLRSEQNKVISELTDSIARLKEQNALLTRSATRQQKTINQLRDLVKQNRFSLMRDYTISD